jgi:hypothetical protein
MGIQTTLISFVNKEWHQKTFQMAVYITWALYAIAFTGAISIDPFYLVNINIFTQIYVGLFLLIRFNPFVVTRRMTDFDIEVAFSGGLFLLLSSATVISFGDVIKQHLSDIT